MKRNGLRYLALAMLLPMVAFGGTARAQKTLMGDKVTVHGLLDVAGQPTDVNGSDEKFNEYRDVDKGFLLNDFRFLLDSTTTPDYLDLRIRDAVQDDERYRLTLGRHGRYKLNLEYDVLPHNFSDGTFLWRGFGTGRLWIPNGVQSQLENFGQTRAIRGTRANVDTNHWDARQQGIVRGFYGAADRVTFSLKRERMGASLEINLTDDVKTWLRVRSEDRDGARVISAGTYERFAQGSGLSHTEDQFVVNGAEMAEPINYRTRSISAGAGVYKKHFLADVEYTFTDFENSIDALFWENPFRLTDSMSHNSNSFTPGNPYERGWFAIGQLVLPPDSRSHDVTASAAVDLPLHSRLAGSLSFGVINQDDAFQPYTHNTAITRFENNTPIGFDVTNPFNLPRSDLGGRVRTTAASLSLSSRPVKPVTVNVKYRHYDYNNESHEVLFPGYAGYGESIFRPVKNDKGAPVQNEVFDYNRNNLDLGIDYRIVKPLTLSLEGGWEGWNFEKLRIKNMDEYSFGGGFIYRPFKRTSLKAAYKYSDRSTSDYLTGRTAANPEATGLFNFNWAERRRNQVDVRFQVAPVETLSVGLMGKWSSEEYGGNPKKDNIIVNDFRFGRTDVDSLMGGLDVEYTPNERVSFFANYLREYRREKMASAAKDDAVKALNGVLGISDDYAAENYWNSNINENIDTFGIGSTVQIVPSRLTLDVTYNFSLSNMEYHNYNPNGYNPRLTLMNAIAQPWPDVSNRLHEVSADLAYNFTKNLKVGLRYLYEQYDLNDFAWNDLQPYMAGLSVENSTKFVFTDATYGGYEANVGAIYMTWKF